MHNSLKKQLHHEDHNGGRLDAECINSEEEEEGGMKGQVCFVGLSRGPV